MSTSFPVVEAWIQNRLPGTSFVSWRVAMRAQILKTDLKTDIHSLDFHPGSGWHLFGIWTTHGHPLWKESSTHFHEYSRECIWRADLLIGCVRQLFRLTFSTRIHNYFDHHRTFPSISAGIKSQHHFDNLLSNASVFQAKAISFHSFFGVSHVPTSS